MKRVLRVSSGLVGSGALYHSFFVVLDLIWRMDKKW